MAWSDVAASVRRRRPPALLVLVPVALAAWVYLPIRHIWFFSDDLMQLASIAADPVLAFLLRPFGGHNCLVRNLVFLVSWDLFGLRASFYYWTVLLTHLLNVALLFGVLEELSGSAWVACLGAVAWGTSPLVAGTLGWYSVYGQVLVGTILLVVLLRLARLARRQAPVPARTAVWWYVLLLAGTTCFGIGIAVALVFPVVLFVLLPAAWRQPGVRLAFLALPLVTLALYYGFRRLYASIEPLSIEEEFQLSMALHGLPSVPGMLVHLLGFSLAGSMLGFFMPATYPDLRAGLALATFTLALGVVLLRADWRVRRLALATAALAVASYGMIAVGRAAVYSAFHVRPEVAATVLRYHYAPSLPVVMLLALVAGRIGGLGILRALPRPLVLGAAVALGAWGYARSGSPVPDFRQSCRDYFFYTMAGVTSIVRAAPPGRTVYVDNGTTPRYVLGPALPPLVFPGRAAVFLLSGQGDTLEGRPVRFVERDAGVLAYYRARPANRLGHLLVAPEDSGGAVTSPAGSGGVVRPGASASAEKSGTLSARLKIFPGMPTPSR